MTDADLKDALGLLDPAARAQVTATPQALANFVRERLLNLSVLAQAKAKGRDTRPEVMRRMNEAASAVVLQTYLQAQVPPDPAFPTEADVTAAFEANKSHLILPKQYHLAQIVVGVKPGATPEEEEAARKKASDLRTAALRPKADFAEIAKKNSQDPASAGKRRRRGSAARAGHDAGGARGRVWAAGRQTLSQPVRVPDGWHVLKAWRRSRRARCR